MKRRGFTMIELAVVIALIALLATMLVMAIGHMQVNGKRQQTKMIMQNLSAMFADYDVNRRVPFGMGNASFSALSVANQNALLDNVYAACPHDVTSGGSDRTGSQVQLTRYFMAQMMSIPSNATAIGKLPSGSLMTFVGVNPTPPPAAWIYSNSYSVYQGATDAAGNIYVRTQVYMDPLGTGTILQDGQPNSATPAVPTYTINAPPNYYYWMPALVVPTPPTPLPTPVVLDAWGNPIIFVMGGVLGARPGNAKAAPADFLIAGGNQFQVHSPDYHPFFASAGPDGDFSKGDDNLYSYEK